MEKPLKILMLEDSEFDAEIIQQVLLREKPGSVFMLVMTEEAFTEALEQFEPDLILSDNTLPQFSATEALKIFNRRSLHIPFILVTGTVSEEFAAGIIKLGADDYILKDRLTRLPTAIDAALKQRRIENENLEAQNKLAASEEKYRLLFERNLAGVYQYTVDGRVTGCNAALARMLGYSVKEAEQENAYGFYFSTSARDEIISHLNKDGQLTDHETVLKHREGREVHVIENISLHRDTKSGEYLIEAVMVDITERKKAEDEIRFAANLLKTVGQAVIATDMNGRVIYWNNAAEKMYGWTADEARGRNIIDLTPAQQSKEQAIEIMNELIGGHTWSGEFMVQGKEGTVFPAFVSDSPVYDRQGKLAAIIGVSVDLTETKQAEENLRVLEQTVLKQKIQEQKKISRAIIKAQEQEKNHIGRELHDNVNQILASTKIFLAMAGKKNEELKELIKYPLQLIDTSIEEIRLLTQRQVTPLKNINLQQLIPDLFSKLDTTKTANPVFIYSVPDELVSDELKLNIYRMIQEQLNNIVKHAAAQNINITIQAMDGFINILIADDGKGFDVQSRRKGIGISNMINRIESYNGEMRIDSSPGNGCTVSIKIPL